jgi:hypothetical protein
MIKDPLLALINLKSLEEIITAAKETIHRHRRRYLQRNLRVYPGNCKLVSTMGNRIVGCTGCKSPNPSVCLHEQQFIPRFSKEELAKQFANLLRNPEALLRDYRDVTVFLWVLGAFNKQEQQINEEIVASIEEHKSAKKAGT